jgi:hypothetical protein
MTDEIAFDDARNYAIVGLGLQLPRGLRRGVRPRSDAWSAL